LRLRSRDEEVLEHLSSWERTFWEMLQDQKRQGKNEAEQADECKKSEDFEISGKGLRRNSR